ncbi:reticulon-4-interacting protein 1 homolog, mitochondrial-like isoform X2 [Engraulis encrasicolus]|uniref:reticulon-4-interacting protein 1 homolog, mitochondrial-like isoform X2 n=1 Tax=Engraulis encrasicolus TaxID=184585 RepID=UPI002FD4B99A
MLACQRWLRPPVVNFLKFNSNLRVDVGKVISRSVAKSYHGASMRAWVINQYGTTNDVLTLSENYPAPGVNFAHDVVLQVHAVGLNPLDIAMRGGYGAGVLRLRRDPRTLLQDGVEFPLVLGRDVSGVVLQCGSGVKHVQEGDEVWASVPPWQQGSLADYILLNGSDVSLKPKSLSHVEAASIPYVAGTAWSALVNTGGLHSENCSKKRILVHGASGGVGTLAIQLLKAWGGHVTATCFQEGVGLVKELGADDVIDCTAGDAASQLGTLQKFDLILDNVGGETESWAMDLLKPWAGSKFVTLVSPLLRNTDALGLVDGVMRSGLTLHDKAIRSVTKGVFYRWAFYVPDGVALDRIGELVSSGKIRPVVEATFPFSQVPEAFLKVETGQARGKTVISVAATEEEEAESSSTSPPSSSSPHIHGDGPSPVTATQSDVHPPAAAAAAAVVTSLLAEEQGHLHSHTPAVATASGPHVADDTSAEASVAAAPERSTQEVMLDQVAEAGDSLEALEKDKLEAAMGDKTEAAKGDQAEAATTTSDSSSDSSSESSSDSDSDEEGSSAEAAPGSTTTTTTPTADTEIPAVPSPEGTMTGDGSITTADTSADNRVDTSGSSQATAATESTAGSTDSNDVTASGSKQATDDTNTTTTTTGTPTRE